MLRKLTWCDKSAQSGPAELLPLEGAETGITGIRFTDSKNMGYLFNIPSSRSAPSYTSPIIELYVPFPLLPYYGLTAMVSELLLALVALITLFLCVGNMAAGPACRMMCATVGQFDTPTYRFGDQFPPNYLVGITIEKKRSKEQKERCSLLVTVTDKITVRTPPLSPTHPPPQSQHPAKTQLPAPSPAPAPDPTLKERAWQVFVSSNSIDSAWVFCSCSFGWLAVWVEEEPEGGKAAGGEGGK